MARCRMQTCASCEEFPMKASMETAGRATCAIFQKPRDYTDTACVLYNQARDPNERRALANRLREAEQKKEEPTA